MSTTQQLLDTTKAVRIVSGEGDCGTVEQYTGARTIRAIRARLTREQCGGQRFARAEYVSWTDADGNHHFARLPL